MAYVAFFADFSWTQEEKIILAQKLFCLFKTN